MTSRARATVLGVAAAVTASACGALAHLRHPDRDEWQQPDRVVGSLRIQPGQRVADVGAGSGYFTFRLAAATGPRGKVYAIEVSDSKIRALRERARKLGHANVHPVRARTVDPSLPEGSVDLVFICNAYHHLDDRVAYFKRMKRYLRAGGRIAIIELENVSWIYGL